MGSATTIPTANALDVIRQHRRTSPTIFWSRPWHSARKLPTYFSVSISDYHRHKSFHNSRDHGRRIYVGAPIRARRSQSLLLPSSLVIIRRNAKPRSTNAFIWTINECAVVCRTGTPGSGTRGGHSTNGIPPSGLATVLLWSIGRSDQQLCLSHDTASCNNTTSAALSEAIHSDSHIHHGGTRNELLAA